MTIFSKHPLRLALTASMLIAGLVVASLTVTSLRADVPNFVPPAEEEQPLVTAASLQIDLVYEDLSEQAPGMKAKLLIPAGAIPQIPGAALPGLPDAPDTLLPPGGLEIPGESTSTEAPQSVGPIGLGTVMAGLAISLAIVSGGLLLRGNLLRNNPKLRTTTVALLVLGVTVGTYSIAAGDLIVPGQPRANPRPRPGVKAPDHMVIEVVKDLKKAKLIIHRAE